MRSNREHMLVRGESKVESEERALIGQRRDELNRGLRIDIPREFEVHAINGNLPVRQHLGGNPRMARDLIAKVLSPGVENLLAMLPEVVGDARRGADRRSLKLFGED